MARPSFAHLGVLCVPLFAFTAVLAHRQVSSGEADGDRLRRHFALVERELKARDVSRLTDVQRAARARHIERLRAYARAGVFPRNTDFPGRRMPYFIDRFGTRCAMAYLIEQSGHGDYVRRVAQQANNAYIVDLADDPELAGPLLAWLEENGLTVTEAARIQPSYCDGGLWVGPNPPPCPEPGPVPAEPRTTVAYAAGSAAVAIIGGTSIVLNAWRPQPQWLGALGAATGALGFTMGFFHLDDPGADRALGVVNLGVGAAATYFGMRNLARRGRRPPAEPPVAAVAPWVTSDASGLVVSVRF